MYFFMITIIFMLCFPILSMTIAPVKVILDTDIALDVDDAGALALLHNLADAGDCEILGIIVSSSSTAYDGYWGVPCVSAINTYYGRPEIPIGVYKGLHLIPDRVSNYTQQVAKHFPHPIFSGEFAPDGVKVYRQLLAKESDKSVVIVTIGFLNVLEELLNSKPDEFSPLNGIDLVRQKVKFWSCMGGFYPEGREEFNFNTFSQATKNVLERWPVEVVFQGAEFGEKVLTGARLVQKYDIQKHPVAMGYHYYTGGKNRASWDQISTLFAVRGLQDLFGLKKGHNHLIFHDIRPPDKPISKNVWKSDENGPHAYLYPLVSYEKIAEIIEELMGRR
ncbi:nucleoside hydrolase [candidate division KSB1 bacterium]|nr:nucleoside hydrolase [candidate division KSB1 bacterium]